MDGVAHDTCRPFRWGNPVPGHVARAILVRCHAGRLECTNCHSAGPDANSDFQACANPFGLTRRDVPAVPSASHARTVADANSTATADANSTAVADANSAAIADAFTSAYPYTCAPNTNPFAVSDGYRDR